MASNTSLMASKVVLIPNGRDAMDSVTSGDLFLLCKGDMYNLSVFSPEWWHQHWDGQIEANMGSWGKLWALACFSDSVLRGSTKKRRGSKIVMQWFYNGASHNSSRKRVFCFAWQLAAWRVKKIKNACGGTRKKKHAAKLKNACGGALRKKKHVVVHAPTGYSVRDSQERTRGRARTVPLS